ncbi:MAG: PIG-L family deacetylase [Bacteroidota bacterium]
MLLRSLLLLAFFAWGSLLHAQQPLPAKTSAEIQHMLKKLTVLGSVLYVAAHPDDENTRMIAYLAQGKGYRTRYLALTRGDGGQNLIGNEKGVSLGILRTQELLAARRIDGGEQMFSRAYDFGYSKNPEETLAFWDQDKVLADVVWAIRTYRPDVIITRFATPEKGGGGHGHHTSSAILAHKAFDLAGDPNAFPEQLTNGVEPWQPTRLMWNNYWVFRRYEPTEEDLKNIVSVNIGQYDPLLGKNYGEIASEARSMHRCQAFGNARIRGELIEYLDNEKGARPINGDLFSGIDATWSRVQGGEAVGRLLEQAYTDFDPTDPSKSLPNLLEAYQKLEGLSGPWAEFKCEQLREAIVYCAGLWCEINPKYPTIAQGDSIELSAEYLKRTTYGVTLKSIEIEGLDPIQLNETLSTNPKVQKHSRILSTANLPISQPYWLQEEMGRGMFRVSDQEKIGLPENPAVIKGIFRFIIDGVEIPFEVPVQHRYVDRAIGELYRPFLITPKVTVNVAEKVYVFASNVPQEIELSIKNFSDSIQATISFQLPEGWKATPSQLSYDFSRAGEEQSAKIQVTPPAFQSKGKIQVMVTVDGKTTTYSQQTIGYDHIPTQMLFNASEAELVRVDLQKKGKQIAYIMGSGDEVPKGLEQMGYNVTQLADEDITLDNLNKYDAVIAGIRAYNRRKRLAFLQDIIFEYVEAGGTYVVQYNTTYDLSTKQPSPYPITLSRDRVSVEDAPVTFLKPDHPVLNTPNKITKEDFEGWVQERGLYFPAQWDEKFDAILSWHDFEETPKNGALLVAEYGKGHFVYTGISWFRELPAGVPGAFRLFANIISIGQEEMGEESTQEMSEDKGK